MTDLAKPSSSAPVEVRLTAETIDYLDRRVASAVQEGIKAAMTGESAKAFWGAGFELLQEQASAQAGRWVIGGLGALVRRVSTFVVLGLLVYSIGGWSALTKLWNAVMASGG